jgi:hypothetical protein
VSPAPEFHPRDFRRSLRGTGFTRGEYRVAVELSEFTAIGRPVVWPSMSLLAENCCMDVRSVKRIIRRLEAKRVVVCVTRSKGGRGHTSHWRLCVLPQETMTQGSPFSQKNHDPDGQETMTGGSINHDPDGQKTMTPWSPEVVIEEEKKKGARAGKRTAQPASPPHRGHAQKQKSLRRAKTKPSK